MRNVFLEAIRTLGEHVGPAMWAMAIFAAGFLLAFPVVRLDVRSLMALPLWFVRVAKRYLVRGVHAAGLWAFVFGFNTAAIFLYMISGGLVIPPILFALFTGLHVGVVLVKEASGPAEGSEPPPRAWIGFLALFVVVVELSAFWLAIGMGMRIGHVLRAGLTWETFAAAAEPRVVAYVLILVPALAVSAAAETAAIKGMLRTE